MTTKPRKIHFLGLSAPVNGTQYKKPFCDKHEGLVTTTPEAVTCLRCAYTMYSASYGVVRLGPPDVRLRMPADVP